MNARWCALAVLGGLLTPLSALDWHDAGREPIQVGGGIATWEPAARKASAAVGAAFTAGVLLPVEAAFGPPGIDFDWRSNQGAQGAIDHASLMATLRHTLDRTGVYVGAGAGLGYGGYRSGESDLVTTSGLGPCAKGVVGYGSGPLFVEAAYLFPRPLGDLRLDGFALMVGFRFGSGWYRP